MLFMFRNVRSTGTLPWQLCGYPRASHPKRQKINISVGILPHWKSTVKLGMPTGRRERDFLAPECFVKGITPYGSSRRPIVKVNESLCVPKPVQQEFVSYVRTMIIWVTHDMTWTSLETTMGIVEFSITSFT